MGIRVDISYNPGRKKITTNNIVVIRADTYDITIWQTNSSGEDIHLITYNSTGSLRRAKKWGRLKKWRIIRKWCKSWGVMNTIRLLYF